MPAITRSTEGAAFELGKHAKHLNHHSAHRRPRVQGLSCGTEDNMRVVELFENLCQSTNRARKTIDSIDEHEVKATKSAIGERALQLRSLQSATRHPVAVLARELPALLAGDVGAKACVLGLERVGLMLLVSRDPCVSRDSHVDPFSFNFRGLRGRRRAAYRSWRYSSTHCRLLRH